MPANNTVLDGAISFIAVPGYLTGEYYLIRKSPQKTDGFRRISINLTTKIVHFNVRFWHRPACQIRFGDVQ